MDVPTRLILAAATGSPLPSTVTRPLMRRVCAKALALTSTSSNSEKTDERILFMPVSSFGWVGLAAQAQQAQQSSRDSAVFLVAPIYGSLQRVSRAFAASGTSDADKILFPDQQKRRLLAGVFSCPSSV